MSFSFDRLILLAGSSSQVTTGRLGSPRPSVLQSGQTQYSEGIWATNHRKKCIKRTFRSTRKTMRPRGRSRNTRKPCIIPLRVTRLLRAILRLPTNRAKDRRIRGARVERLHLGTSLFLVTDFPPAENRPVSVTRFYEMVSLCCLLLCGSLLDQYRSALCPRSIG